MFKIIGERIKKIREEKDLTQSELADIIGTSRSVVANIEGNRVEPRDWFIKSICREFPVNEKWIVSGIGNMFNDLSKDIDVSKHIKDFNLEPEIEEFLQLYLSVDEDTKKYVKGLMKKTISK